MKIFNSLWIFLISFIFYQNFIPHFVFGSSLDLTISNHSPNNLKNKEAMQHKLSDEMIKNIKLHGILLWLSIGFLMPIGVLLIRMANNNKANENGRKTKVYFYLHLIFQILAVVLATIGAIMSLRTLENSFDNNHQRLGLALYAAIWLQFLSGVFKPSREKKKKRLKWVIIHWLLGTIVSIVGIVNIYTGISAYHKKTSSSSSSSGQKSTNLWTILFTLQLSCLFFFYLFQDKWEYFQQHNNNNNNNNNHDQITNQNVDSEQQKADNVPNLQSCRKSNALVNLFKSI